MTKFDNPLLHSEKSLVNPIYRITEAAKILNCNERCLAAKFRKGEIKAGKKSGQWLVTHNDLVDYVRS